MNYPGGGSLHQQEKHPTGVTQMSNGGPAEELLERYRAAVYAKDVDAFLALYDKDVRVFDMWGTWAYQGADEWRGMVTEWFGSLGTEKVGVKWDDLHADAGDDMAVV